MSLGPSVAYRLEEEDPPAALVGFFGAFGRFVFPRAKEKSRQENEE